MKFKSICTLSARIMTVAAIFSLVPFPYLAKLFLPIAIVFSLLSDSWRLKYQLLKKNYVVILTIVLVFLFAVSTLYSNAPFHHVTSGFFRYTKLLYLLFLIPLFAQQKWRNIATNTLIASVFLDIVASFLILHGFILHPSFYLGYTDGGHNAISVTTVLGFIEFVLINRLVDNKKYRWFYLALFSIGFYGLFFLYTERTGQAIFLALLVLVLWQRFNWRGLLSSFLVLPLLVGVLFLFSHNFRDRLTAGANDIITYNKTNQHKNGTSLGLRLAFAQYSFKAIKEHPFFGNGVGSFKTVYAKTAGPCLTGESEKECTLQHPHNEYVMFTLQFGFFGLICYLCLLIAQWFETKKLPLEERHYAQGLILGFIVLGFCYSAFIGLTGTFYVIFISVYLAARYDKDLNST